MTLKKILQVLATEEEKEQLTVAAKNKFQSLSQYLLQAGVERMRSEKE